MIGVNGMIHVYLLGPMVAFVLGAQQWRLFSRRALSAFQHFAGIVLLHWQSNCCPLLCMIMMFGLSVRVSFRGCYHVGIKLVQSALGGAQCVVVLLRGFLSTGC